MGRNPLEFHSEETGATPVARSNSPIAQLVEQSTVNAWAAGSSPARGAMLTVAQSVELQIVILVVASSILVCQPTAPSSSFGLGRRIVNPVTWVQIPLGPPHYRCLAQMGEHFSNTEKVAGSTPATPTKKTEKKT